MSPAVEIVGLAAGVCTTLAFIPQVLKARRTRSVDDLSLAMLVTFCAGVVLWICYGVLIRSVPVILANTATLGLAGTLVWLKIK